MKRIGLVAGLVMGGGWFFASDRATAQSHWVSAAEQERQRAADTPVSGLSAQRRQYQRHWTPLHLDVVVDDIDAAVAKALAAGARLEQPVAAQGYGRLALMADPFGHGFCFVQFIGGGYDEIADAAEGCD